MITMGQGIYSAATYQANTASRIASGTNFAYSQSAKASGNYKAHETLDPKKKAGITSPFAGQVMRESRDNADHPNSTPISIAFDVTGSMFENPGIIQRKLKDLFGVLLRKGYVEDPQIMTMAYGDAKCDYIPLQASEYESDNRIDDCLDNVVLEGHGGGNGGESSMLAGYFVAHHTATDAWDKRKKKGYLFFVGDEISHTITADQVKEYIGDGEPLGSLDSKDIAAALQERYNVFFLLIDNMQSRGQRSQEFYTNLFGKQNVLMLEDAEGVAETIALCIGVTEGTIDSIDDGEDDLLENGSNALAIRTATNAVRNAGLANLVGAGTLAKGDAGLDFGTGSGAGRL